VLDPRPMSDPKSPRKEGGPSTFNYDGIPTGYYDRVTREGNPIRRLWHVSKFERVLDYLPPENAGSILDVGCFAGTFLSMVPRYRFERQVGADILPAQIQYANENHGSPFRKFVHVENLRALENIGEPFDWVTLIEVIEHLNADEIRTLFTRFDHLLKKNGGLIITTPNYTSAWPILEQVLNRVSEVSYEEQHITRFSYFNFERKLRSIDKTIPDRYSVELKTTTHFITPFLATLSYEIARGLSRVVPHRTWNHPLGNLMLVVLRKK
jgi:2-polyprenyl-3-methyl-5-hydroxy-6-metoxy-1,4-benzoquinol methylase